MKEVRIFDMDGVLVDSSHRYRAVFCEKKQTPKIDLNYWRENENKCLQDTLLPTYYRYYKPALVDPEIYVIIATSRVTCQNCHYFIDNILGKPNMVIHRKNNEDQRRSFDLKANPLKRLQNLPQFNPRKVLWRFWEDNLETLALVCEKLKAIPHYIPSNQGW